MENLCRAPWSQIVLTNYDGRPAVQPCSRFILYADNKKYVKESFSTPEHAFSKHGYFQNIRNRMMKNRKLPECQKCWDEEAIGKKSMRQTINALYPDDTPKIQSIEIFLSNLCNFACRMCNITYSTSWGVLYSKSFKIDNLRDSYIVPGIFLKDNELTGGHVIHFNDFETEKLDLSSLKHIKILGGEPFMEPQHAKILEFLIDENPNINLEYVTNGSKFPTKEIINLWRKCKSVKICFSLDGYGDIHEYIRVNSNWNEIESNIKLYLDLDIDIKFSINTTVSVLSLWGLNELLDWRDNTFKSKPLLYHSFNLVTTPKYLDISIIPKEHKELYEKRILRFNNLNNIHKKNIIKHLNSNKFDENRQKELLNELKIKMNSIDRYTGKKLMCIIPFRI